MQPSWYISVSNHSDFTSTNDCRDAMRSTVEINHGLAPGAVFGHTSTYGWLRTWRTVVHFLFFHHHFCVETKKNTTYTTFKQDYNRHNLMSLPWNRYDLRRKIPRHECVVMSQRHTDVNMTPQSRNAHMTFNFQMNLFTKMGCLNTNIPSLHTFSHNLRYAF